MSNLTPAQKAAITRNKKAAAAKQAKATTELSNEAADDIGVNDDDDVGLDNVFNKKQAYLKTRSIEGGVIFTQDGCRFDCHGNPLSLIED